jgi:hypothetical protein
VKSYYEKLRDPRWQRKRLEVMSAAGFKCEHCGNAEVTLNVHHRFYVRGLNPWEYSQKQLACLCERCHKEVTGLMDMIAESLADFGVEQFIWLAGYICEIRTSPDFWCAERDAAFQCGEDDAKRGGPPTPTPTDPVSSTEPRIERTAGVEPG